MKKFYLALLVLLCFVACNKNELINRADEKAIKPPISIDNKKSIEFESFVVTPKMLDCYLHYFTEHRVVDLIKPLADNDDTLAYYVQYANNEGWDVISADCRTAPVLTSSSKGSLSDVNLTTMVTSDGLQAVKEIRNSERKNYNGIWAFVYGAIKDKTIKCQPKTKGNRGLVTGMWIAQDTSIVHNTDSIAHLIETEWHQTFPWNDAMPFYNGRIMPVGCGPIAVAQVVYKYVHNNPGSYTIPTYCQRSNSSHYNDTMYFSNESTLAWNNMAETILDNKSQVQTGIYLSWMRQDMNASFIDTITIVYENNVKSELNKYLSYREGQDVNGSYNKRKIFRDTVFHSLNQGSPILLSTNVVDRDDGHIYLIDAYQIETTERIIRYVFDADHVVTDDEYYSLPSWMFDWPSMGQFPDFDPGKEGSAVIEDRQELNYSEYIKMNWGLSHGSGTGGNNNPRYLLYYRTTYYYDGGSSYSEDYPLHSWPFQGDTYYNINFWLHHFTR